MLYNSQQLSLLELTNSDLNNLSPKEQFKKIRQQWIKLSYKYHPDKNPSNPLATQNFQKISEAYNFLTKKKKREDQYFSEINNYFKKIIIDIPETAFDLLLLENIETAYSELKLAFLELKTEDEKKSFGAQYASFLNLAQSLEEIQGELNKKRANYLFKQEKETLKIYFTREWRTLIIRLFAEEYLDDFQYRQALATGKLAPILATRKLVSPIKILVAILNSINLMICSSGHYFEISLTSKIATDFLHQYSAYKSGKITVIKASIIALEIIGSALLICSPLYFIPTIAFSALGLPMIATTLECLASPVNKLIKPLAAYTKLSPFGLTTLFSILGAAAIYGLISTAMFTSALFLLEYASLALSFYCLYGMTKLIHNMYKLMPALGIFQSLFITSIMLISFLMPSPNATLPINIIANFFTVLSSSSVLYWGNIFFENPSVGMAKKIEVLPLPEEEIPDSIKEATLQGNKKTAQSHRFFNTPKDAEFLEKEDRTFRQQTTSFFGGDTKKSIYIAPHYEQVQSMLAIQPLSL